MNNLIKALLLVLLSVSSQAQADDMKELILEKSVSTYQVEYVLEGHNRIAEIAANSEKQALDVVRQQLKIPEEHIKSIKKFL